MISHNDNNPAQVELVEAQQIKVARTLIGPGWSWPRPQQIKVVRDSNRFLGTPTRGKGPISLKTSLIGEG
jgi:hypothetical protein